MGGSMMIDLFGKDHETELALYKLKDGMKPVEWSVIELEEQWANSHWGVILSEKDGVFDINIGWKYRITSQEQADIFRTHIGDWIDVYPMPDWFIQQLASHFNNLYGGVQAGESSLILNNNNTVRIVIRDLGPILSERQYVVDMLQIEKDQENI